MEAKTKPRPRRHTRSGRDPASQDGHEKVGELPARPAQDTSYWLDSPNGRHEHLHLLFRFPARFHPPVVRWALRQHNGKGFVLDPFTGSGTVQLEALAKGISSLGLDVDPLSCLVAKAKTTPLAPKKLKASLQLLKRHLAPYEALHATQANKPGGDISKTRFEDESAELWVPDILNIEHWFRRYVIVDLARVFWAMDTAGLSSVQARFFNVCAAAIVRRVSNADPAPVSGLEVTHVQAERNMKRKIHVFDEFYRKVEQGIAGMEALEKVRTNRQTKARVLEADALELGTALDHDGFADEGCGLVVTSPPYCRAVEYSRRHRLEMYWLDLIEDEAEHLELTHRYIGRNRVRATDWDEDIDFEIAALDRVIERIAEVSETKARGVRHYFHSMNQVLSDLASRIEPDGSMVWVIGDSICAGVKISTADFIAALAERHLRIANRFSYALRNHYMQYGLWNGAGIKHEHVLILKPRQKRRGVTKRQRR